MLSWLSPALISTRADVSDQPETDQSQSVESGSDQPEPAESGADQAGSDQAGPEAVESEQSADATSVEEPDSDDAGPPSAAAVIDAKRAIEAIVLVASDPIPTQLLAQLIEFPVDAVAHLCSELAAEYREQRRGFQLAEVAGGWRFQTHPAMAAYVERFALEGQSARLSAAALETLAIVAYKQPISRGQVSAIRGVNVDGVLRTLEQRGYIEERARDAGPGQAILFGTTDLFLDKLGLAEIGDLPPLGEFVPAASVVEALENTLRAEAEDAARAQLDQPDDAGDANGSDANGSDDGDVAVDVPVDSTSDEEDVSPLDPSADHGS